MSVVDLPLAKRLCSGCENGYLGQGGVFCRFFREDIFDETVAQECGEWTPIPLGPVKVSIVGGPAPTAGPPPPGADPFHGRRTPDVLDERRLEALCERLIGSKHSTMWGQFFMVTAPDERREAAEWLARQFRDVAALAAREETDGSPADQHADAPGALRAAERNGETHASAAAAHPAQGEPGSRPVRPTPVPDEEA